MSRWVIVIVLALTLPVGSFPTAASLDIPDLLPTIFGSGIEEACEPDGDAGPNAAGAIMLPHPGLCRGTLAPVNPELSSDRAIIDNIDTYAFELVETETVPIAATSRTIHINVCTTRPDGASGSCGELANETANVVLSGMAGTWTVQVFTIAGTGFGEYTLWAGGAEVGDGLDCGTATDAPGSSEFYGGPGDLAVGFPTDCAGSMPAADTVDWYEAEIPSGSFVEVLAQSESTTMRLCILAPDSLVYRCAWNDQNVARFATDAEGGVWHIGVYRHSNTAPTDYHFSIQAAAVPARDDCASGTDASWRTPQALALTWPTTCEGSIDAFDNVDIFAITLARDQFLHLTLQTPGRMEICARDPVGGFASDCAYSTQNESLRLGDKAGVWYFTVKTWDGPVNFTLNVEALDRGVEDDCGLGRDAKDVIDPDWDPIHFPVTCTGWIDDVDEGDYLEVTLEQGALVEVRLDGFPFMCLVSPSGSQLECFDQPHVRRTLEIEDGGVWRINVAPVGWISDPHRYNYSLSLQPGTPMPPQNDCGLGRDARNGQHDPIQFPIICTGAIDSLHNDISDRYTFNVPEGQAWRVQVDAPPEANVCIAHSEYQYDCGNDVWSLWTSGRVDIYIGGAQALDGYAYALRTDAARTQFAQGTYLVGDPLGRPLGPPGGQTDGLTGSWFKLDQVANAAGTQRMSLASNNPLGAQLDYYDDSLQRLGGCTSSSSSWCGDVPAGAAWAYVFSNVGASPQYAATYTYFAQE